MSRKQGSLLSTSQHCVSRLVLPVGRNSFPLQSLSIDTKSQQAGFERTYGWERLIRMIHSKVQTSHIFNQLWISNSAFFPWERLITTIDSQPFLGLSYSCRVLPLDQYCHLMFYDIVRRPFSCVATDNKHLYGILIQHNCRCH